MTPSSNTYQHPAADDAASWARTDRDELLAAVAHEAGHPVAATTQGVLIGAAPATVMAIADRNSIRIIQLADAASVGFPGLFRRPAAAAVQQPAAAA